MENKSYKRKFRGVVVSNKTDKTVVVETKRLKTHKKYGKKISISKKFMAHDEKNECKIGDVVEIEETRPISKRKCWEIKSIKSKVEGQKDNETTAETNDGL